MKYRHVYKFVVSIMPAAAAKRHISLYGCVYHFILNGQSFWPSVSFNYNQLPRCSDGIYFNNNLVSYMVYFSIGMEQACNDPIKGINQYLMQGGHCHRHLPVCTYHQALPVLAADILYFGGRVFSTWKVWQMDGISLYAAKLYQLHAGLHYDSRNIYDCNQPDVPVHYFLLDHFSKKQIHITDKTNAGSI